MRLRLAYACLVATVPSLGHTQSADDFRLPSEATVKAIERLDVSKESLWNPDASKYTTFELEPSLNPVLGEDAEPPTIIAPNSVLIQVHPDLSEQGLKTLLEEKDLTVIGKYPEIGTIKVLPGGWTWSSQGGPIVSGADQKPNPIELRSVFSTLRSLEADPRVMNAAPDTILGIQEEQFSNIMSPDVVEDPLLGTNVEHIDWGVSDIEADKLWPLPGAGDAVKIGVLDAGFARHDDLAYFGFDPDVSRADWRSENHGNHVAGIACARHDNAGIRGVLRSCMVRAKKGGFAFAPEEGGRDDNFLTAFSDIVVALYDFVRDEPDVTTFNVSLGYNWRMILKDNEEKSVNHPIYVQERQLVERQGRIIVQMLQYAEKNDKLIFSAAGNDSTSETVEPAKFASPFNWGAAKARELRLSTAGIVVEAHDTERKRAAFSNGGGDISCPGIDVLSTIAFDAQKNPSQNAYGRMSGTSMASPYCAAGLQLFRMVRPQLTSTEAFKCLVTMADRTDSGTPMLKLTNALAACP